MSAELFDQTPMADMAPVQPDAPPIYGCLSDAVADVLLSKSGGAFRLPRTLSRLKRLASRHTDSSGRLEVHTSCHPEYKRRPNDRSSLYVFTFLHAQASD
jgi:hypothetical protein